MNPWHIYVFCWITCPQTQWLLWNMHLLTLYIASLEVIIKKCWILLYQLDYLEIDNPRVDRWRNRVFGAIDITKFALHHSKNMKMLKVKWSVDSLRDLCGSCCVGCVAHDDCPMVPRVGSCYFVNLAPWQMCRLMPLNVLPRSSLLLSVTVAQCGAAILTSCQ